MASPAQSPEVAPDYEQCFEKRRRGCDWDYTRRRGRRLRCEKAMRKVTHTRRVRLEFAQKEGIS